MARMLELIREGKAPTSIVRRGARGELSVEPGEAIAILATLIADGEVGGEAEQTLQRWEESSLREVASDAATAPEVLRCLLRTHAERPAVIESLSSNPAMAIEELESAASHGGAATLQAMLSSGRVRNSRRLLELMAGNPAAEPFRSQLNSQTNSQTKPWQARAEIPEADESIEDFLLLHTHELALENDAQRFELVPASDGEADPLAELLAKVGEGVGPPEEESPQQESPVESPDEPTKLSLLQRIGRLRVGERIKLAMRGSREERSVLIRDRSKLVALAVVASPKVNETEMESFAAMKNVQESVLRAIAGNRKNMKHYGIIKTLANNPKTPLDTALPLIAHLQLKDVRALATNKDVNETIRKRAKRLFLLKTEHKEG
jgi:hypothetical protein